MTKIVDYTQKPKRPFGVSLALFASFVLFTVIPILEVLIIISIDNMMVFDEKGRAGLNIIGIDGFRQQMALQAAIAIGFFVLIVLTWFGRPQVIRYLFSGVIALMGILTIVLQIIPRLQAAPTVMDSTREVSQPILLFYLVITILITLYVIWYMNRWAARAYFRGYYLPEDIEELKRIEAEMMSSADKLKHAPTT